MTFLTRIDPSRNINRFYVVQGLPTLFGDWTVLREWGRRGSPGTMRLSSYERRNDARDRRAAHDQAPATARLQGDLPVMDAIEQLSPWDYPSHIRMRAD